MLKRRNKRGDGAGEMIGQDSFLDIVSNIVGILIILVMIAGVRAQNSPLVVEAPDGMEALRPEEAEPEIRYAALQTTQEIQTLQEEYAEKAQKALKLREEIEEILYQQALTEEQALAEAELYNELFSLLVSVRAELELYTEEKDKKSKEAFDLQRQIMELDARLEQMHKTRLWLGANRPKATVMENVPTPISKNAEDRELHFRLLHGKIAYVPMKELQDQVSRDVTRNSSKIFRNKETRGTVGPLEGYRMDYLIQTYDAPVRDAYGINIHPRIAFERVVCLPQPDLFEQPVREALASPQSPFRTRLQGVRQDLYTITFWVYPDSFDEFRELKKFLHAGGYNVAAWPLCFDQPISASSEGTKSSIQ